MQNFCCIYFFIFILFDLFQVKYMICSTFLMIFLEISLKFFAPNFSTQIFSKKKKVKFKRHDIYILNIIYIKTHIQDVKL